ncbi:Tetratricopeptide TPR-1 [Heracleum sosnowskyi]|uniref:Tetratricopeptide TPR-1 n=1 Tax=Heracleum sosnowskyi TaxID=360622 RepID=A0AAD8H4D0_9APIA|nr:Tetratricopeptide TPR-1 [Heracleum sosnowskyi]
MWLRVSVVLDVLLRIWPSSDQSPSRYSLLSYGQESRIDSELRFLAGGNVNEEKTKEVVMVNDKTVGQTDLANPGTEQTNEKNIRRSASAKSKILSTPITKYRSLQDKPPSGKRNLKTSNKGFGSKDEKFPPFGAVKQKTGAEVSFDEGYLGPYLLKQTRDMVSSGENPKKVLDVALRALKSFETTTDGKFNLDYVMCLHVVSALYCSMGQYKDAIPLLERSIEIPDMDEGQKHALAKFTGCMQLGDTYAMLGLIENSILCYAAGLEIQEQVLGEKDLRLGETCRYVAEAHVQMLQFAEAEKLCQKALDIHRESDSSASLEEAADRRLMGLISDSKGDYETALEHYVLASMSMAANGQEADVAAIDCNIGDAYLSLARYDEAIFAYQKALTVFKSTNGEKHSSVASVFVRLANVYNKIGKFRESKSYCENALGFYMKPTPGSRKEEIGNGLIEVSAIYESMGELDQALKLLKKAIKVFDGKVGLQSTVAGIEAQMGVLYYMMENYSESYNSLKSAIAKFRAIGEKKSSMFAVALNQMGLACVQVYSINEAADLFEEARTIMENEFGPHHPDTLGVYSNLAGTYDAMGRWGDAIEILEHVVAMREEKLGTANPDVDDEKRRLAALLKEAGMSRNRKSRSLEVLLVSSSPIVPEDKIE